MIDWAKADKAAAWANDLTTRERCELRCMLLGIHDRCIDAAGSPRRRHRRTTHPSGLTIGQRIGAIADDMAALHLDLTERADPAPDFIARRAAAWDAKRA